MQKLTKHEVKVARAILIQLFNVPKQRSRSCCDEYVWVSLDNEPRDALRIITESSKWKEVDSKGMNEMHLHHADYPGAVLSVGFDEDGPRRTLVAIKKQVEVPATMTAAQIKEMAKKIVAYWHTPHGRKAAATECEPFRAAVEKLFGNWEETHTDTIVTDYAAHEWDYGPDAYGCLINAVEELNS